MQKEKQLLKHNNFITIANLLILKFEEISSSIELAKTAKTAMYEELLLTPKPGLVDIADSGAHNDMDYNTFCKSIEALSPYYIEIAKAAKNKAASPETFKQLRLIGINAEKAMFAKTKGVNTHKGQFFILATLVAAASCGEKNCKNQHQLKEKVMLLCNKIVKDDFNKIASSLYAQTNGEALYLKSGVKGIRGEAENGFPSIFDLGLPFFIELLNRGISLKNAGIQTLLYLMTFVEDTTVLKRSGKNGLNIMHDEAEKALSLGGIETKEGVNYIKKMNEFFISKNISPGGCADLIAGILFINLLRK